MQLTSTDASTTVGLPQAVPSSSDDGVIVIAGRRYMTQERLALTLRRSIRTISRWDEQRIGPPRIKIGNRVLYDEARIPNWLAEYESKPVKRGRHR